MFSIGDDFLDALLPGGKQNVSWSDACWESKMAEAKVARGGNMQAKQNSSERRLILPLQTEWEFYNCLIKGNTITERR